MAKDRVSASRDSRASYFYPINLEIVASANFRVDSEASQRAPNGFEPVAKAGEDGRAFDKRIIEDASVVINGPASAYAPEIWDIEISRQLQIRLVFSDLMASDYYGRIVLPQEEPPRLGESLGKERVLQREIEGRRTTVKLD